ncbi:hypothetical protein MWN34_12600 [Ancylobacter sp. 6x-1]|uniref:Phage tail tape measure protein n=1 Tax=Ancylobacter crimeensis TaxID=2579147 RepID=A0ABT0DCS4_9HYPH|nr:hypothetical protein [Ancylobacter crimeensis]MCK0197752.1 hypothetical protein [Ancylobacter crimeensis]
MALTAARGIGVVTGVLARLLGLGRTAKTILPASLEGFSRASQNVAKNAREARKATDKMIEGMSKAKGVNPAPAGSALAAGAVVGGVMAGGAALATAATNVVEQNKEMLAGIQDNPILGAMDPAMALAAAVYGPNGRQPDAPFAAQLPPGMKLPAAPPLPMPRPEELLKLDEIEAASKLAFSKIAPALAAEGPKVESEAMSIWERIKGIFGAGISVPIHATEAGGTPVDGARARGGPVGGGGSYIVGERGPELFTPSRSGYVHSAGKTAQMRGSVSIGDISFTINAAPGQSPDDIARAVEARLDRKLARLRSGAFNDGVYG